ncbi:hypothetical protein Harreka1_39 [Olleya phage Harreka_1]|uniref:Uncharacterized protein n=1 Tax=Olleya phage Harreka_1 TaxID=2745673 RepID=A0A8E5EAV8_9CAUD|nr:hypothetical protein M1M26_gp39 [Olleya phage Harreka_1]QQV90446.1 hypothetical protein Harreka1_39 [Olleya phage Harreka_1]
MNKSKELIKLQNLTNNVLGIGDIEKLVAEELGVTHSMIKQVKAGVKWENNEKKLKAVIKAYKKVSNSQNKKIQK